jgi:spore germination protein GerM
MILKRRNVKPGHHPWLMLVALGAFALGALARQVTIGAATTNSPLTAWLPWLDSRDATLFFGDPSTGFLVPITRRFSQRDDMPRALAEALFVGPNARTDLVSVIPKGTSIRLFEFDAGGVQLDLSADFLRGDPELSTLALRQTLASWPGVDDVTISVDGAPMASALRSHVLYFPRADLLVAIPTNAESPRQALATFLDGPSHPGLTGLPADTHLISYKFDPSNGLLSLNLAYSASLREFAIDHPETMRRILLGLIATLTDFPEVQAVMIDFEGHARLGLGQCADLLRTPQIRPTVLNDQRLMGG